MSSLQQTCALPSAIALGKEGFALGKELSAYPLTAKASLPSAACRALGKGFPECHDGTRQNENAKKPKNNSKIFQKKNSG